MHNFLKKIWLFNQSLGAVGHEVDIRTIQRDLNKLSETYPIVR